MTSELLIAQKKINDLLTDYEVKYKRLWGGDLDEEYNFAEYYRRN